MTPSLMRVLDVHQAADLERERELAGLALELGDGLVARGSCGGSEQALSPEWMPASSMCSMMPQMKTSVPSQRQSTSISTARLR